ncbi:hypothetical protein QL285_012555 [Trifolium repens]|nr:hypothetical protein QL285_012555 [Trifolium repens]
MANFYWIPQSCWLGNIERSSIFENMSRTIEVLRHNIISGTMSPKTFQQSSFPLSLEDMGMCGSTTYAGSSFSALSTTKSKTLVSTGTILHIS